MIKLVLPASLHQFDPIPQRINSIMTPSSSNKYQEKYGTKHDEFTIIMSHSNKSLIKIRMIPSGYLT